jgi:hypothetical protein
MTQDRRSQRNNRDGYKRRAFAYCPLSASLAIEQVDLLIRDVRFLKQSGAHFVGWHYA